MKKKKLADSYYGYVTLATQDPWAHYSLLCVPCLRQFWPNITIPALQFLGYSSGPDKQFQLNILCEINCHIC